MTYTIYVPKEHQELANRIIKAERQQIIALLKQSKQHHQNPKVREALQNLIHLFETKYEVK